MTVATPPAATQPGETRLRPTIVLTMLAVAIAPVLVAIALLVSVVRQRPLLARYLERPAHGAIDTAGVARRITIGWGIGLLVIGVLQFVFTAAAGLALLNPVDLLVRTLGAFALEAVLLAATLFYVRGWRSKV